MKQNTTGKRLFYFLLALMIPLCSMATDKKSNIIPAPESIEWQEGSFHLTADTKIVINDHGAKGYDYVEKAINQWAEPLLQKKLKSAKALKEGEQALVIEQDASMTAEAYLLTVAPAQVTIKAGSAAGAFYALQSIRQLIPVEVYESPIAQSVIELPAVTIKDKPFFGYRGMLLDCGRHFFTVDEVKTAIDILALHKMNRLHWHLTEDQGWRIEIKKYPRLTQVGSIRKQTVLGHNSGEFDGVPYGGFYTQEQVKDIVRYAQERFVTIIPEIEIPGHSVAALAAYPELGCRGKEGKYEVYTQWGVTKEICCPGKENTFKFWEDVLTEVLALFPSEYIHIGGDEAPKSEWKQCPDCQALIKKLGLKDEEALQGYVTEYVEKFLNARGRKLIGWDEILEGGVTKNATIMSWRGSAGGIKAAKMGNTVIMTPNSNCYIDHYQDKGPNEPDAIGGYLPLEQAYSLDPYDQLTPDQYKYILGVQGNLWTEYIHTFAQAQYMMLPRIGAIAEVGWSYNHRDLPDFQKRMENLVRYYDVLGYNYAKHIYKSDK